MEKAVWIWKNTPAEDDEFVKFYTEFVYESGSAEIKLSCDSNYTLYVNGNLAGFGQYGDYAHYKVHDELDITPYVRKGKNKAVIIVWYYGADSSVYIRKPAGLIFEIVCGGKTAAVSSPETPSRLAGDYVSHLKKEITSQLGFSYRFDTCAYDGFDRADYIPAGYSQSAAAEGFASTVPRPVKSLKLLPFRAAVPVRKDLYDLGRESVGFLRIVFKAEKGKIVTVAFGEHIADGGVRRKIGARDFTVELVGNGGRFEFCDTFRRLGCRYLEIVTPGTEVEEIGLCETVYPVKAVPYRAKSELRRRIYDTCVRTLELCMHEHYEDCPWREQALYAMDARNQMLCGYYVFRDFAYARANLELMSHGQKADKLLPLCFPAGCDVPIPFFSLIYVTQIYEYAAYSGDLDFAKKKLPLLKDIVGVFVSRIDEKGLIPSMEGYWNFYEWSEGLDGMEGDSFYPKVFVPDYDLALNCHVLYALRNLDRLLRLLGRDGEYEETEEKMKPAVYRTFYDEDKGCFRSFAKKAPHYSKLCNALAVLTGCAFDKAEPICEKLMSDTSEMVDATLSMRCFLYDALLRTDRRNAAFVAKDIEKIYGRMLDCGATSFWETAVGESDFGGAGSLCHGWSALPAYYFHLLSL